MTRTLSMESYLLADADSVVARARQGDETAFEALYRAFEVPVYNLARRICRTTEDAEDVLQETFFEVCRSIGRYREEGSLWGWIRTIAASKALMRLRRNKYRDTDELHDELVGQRKEETHLRMDLEAALERLPEVSRAVVWLHDVEGYTHEEIAGDDGQDLRASRSRSLPEPMPGSGVGWGRRSPYDPPLHRDPGRPAGSRAPSRATPPRGSTWTAATTAGPSWSGCTSGWPGSRRCPRSGPPGTNGPTVRARVRAERRRHRARFAGFAGLAAAASVALAVGVGSLRQTDARPGPAEIEQAMARSQALERALDRINPESRVLDGRTAGIAQELEDRIARVDRELEMAELLEQQSRDAQLLRLWRERVGLLDALVDVHVTRASHVGL